ncbi:MAG: Ig-like domain-containing protein [Haloferacaceae archaeon]
MDLLEDARGQSVQVGAILLFGIVVLFLAMYQANAVPAQNERIEYNAYLHTTSDVEGLRTDVHAAAARDVSTGTTVRTGASYPARVVFVNPGPPGNRLRMREAGTLRIANASAVNGEAANTRAFWDGNRTHAYDTNAIRFDTDYNELRAPSIVYGPGVIYRPANDSVSGPLSPDEAIMLSDQSLVEGDRITLVSVAGDLDAGGYDTTVVSRPVSAHVRTVVITGNDSENVTLTVPTRLADETWNGLLETERASGTVLDVRQNGTDAVDLVLNGSRSYQLRLAKVEVREQTDEPGVSDTEPQYVVGVAGDGASISSDQKAPLTVEVRDRFNNPKSGVDVRFDATNGTFVRNGAGTRTVTTDGEGRASVQFEPDSTGSTTVTAGLDTDGDGSLDDEDALNRTTFDVSVLDGGAGGSVGGSSDPATASGDASGVVVLDSSDANPSADEVKLGLNNTASSELNITGIRLEYATKFSQNKGVQDGPDAIEQIRVTSDSSSYDESRTITATEGQAPSFFQNPLKLESGGSEMSLTLNPGYDLDKDKDALAISVTIYLEGGTAAQYSVYLF